MQQHDSQFGADDRGTNSVCNDGDSHDDCNNNRSLRWVPEKRQGTQWITTDGLESCATSSIVV